MRGKAKGIDNHESFLLPRFKFNFNDLCGILGIDIASKRQSSTSRHYYSEVFDFGNQEIILSKTVTLLSQSKSVTL